ncbi:Uncharacterised protein [Amycolatopsis camponoti]|uniref:Uncharacterized protein n=1 Tax=Amycolatopsis camponoti TaxID=2606593 RepID=A0A6I8LFY1_9PSEU|nr:hypothetical protein [Amycolatopsis camponoti]VVJ16354.1 Uncharacterised protein [Amycolatopsis camponoti]
MLVPGDATDVRRVDLVRVVNSSGWGGWVTVPGETLVSVTGAAASALTALVADLPDGEMMRCFIPSYALRVHGSAGLLCEIAFCFRCHNALVIVPGRGRSRLDGFDADSPAGQDLLARFRAADGPGEATGHRPA